MELKDFPVLFLLKNKLFEPSKEKRKRDSELEINILNLNRSLISDLYDQQDYITFFSILTIHINIQLNIYQTEL